MRCRDSVRFSGNTTLMIMRNGRIYAPAVTTVLRNLTILEGPRAGPESRIIGGRWNLDKIERRAEMIPVGGGVSRARSRFPVR